MSPKPLVLGDRSLGFYGLAKLATSYSLMKLAALARPRVSDAHNDPISSPYVADLMESTAEVVRMAVVAERLGGANWTRLATELRQSPDDVRIQYTNAAFEFRCNVIFPNRQTRFAGDATTYAPAGVTNVVRAASEVERFLAGGAQKPFQVLRRSATEMDANQDRTLEIREIGAATTRYRLAGLFPEGTDHYAIDLALARYNLEWAQYSGRWSLANTDDSVGAAREWLFQLTGQGTHDSPVNSGPEMTLTEMTNLTVAVHARLVHDAARSAATALVIGSSTPGELIGQVVAVRRRVAELRMAAAASVRALGRTWDDVVREVGPISPEDRMQMNLATESLRLDIVRGQLSQRADIKGSPLPDYLIHPNNMVANLHAWLVGDHQFPDTPPFAYLSVARLLADPPSRVMDDLRSASAESFALARSGTLDNLSHRTASEAIHRLNTAIASQQNLLTGRGPSPMQL